MKETRHAGRSGAWAAAAAMAVCALLAAYLGLSALSTLEWQGVYWQDSRQFQTLCQSWNDRVATSVADSIALESDASSWRAPWRSLRRMRTPARPTIASACWTGAERSCPPIWGMGRACCPPWITSAMPALSPGPTPPRGWTAMSITPSTTAGRRKPTRRSPPWRTWRETVRMPTASISWSMAWRLSRRSTTASTGWKNSVFICGISTTIDATNNPT